MYIEQMYTQCLAEAAYYIESNGEAIIIDPLRDTEPYMNKAKERGAKIKYIFETHFHADFVSGHVDLARETGADIVYGPTADCGYDVIVASDNQVFQIGDITITVLHTPGHTPESSTYLLKTAAGKDHAIFSGDTLFIGDVGRPDLAIKSNLTREDLAGQLYDSLSNKIMPLGNDVIVYPGHGAGSSCGKNMSAETFDTLGHQKEVNYALQDLTKEEFVEQVTTGILPPPQYFPKNAMLNKQGYASYDSVMEKGITPLSVDAFSDLMEKAIVLDTRSQLDFPKGFVPGSIFMGIDGAFATWVGTLITNIDQPIIFIADEGREEEVVRRLARVGYDNCLGYLEGGIAAWEAEAELDSFTSISATEFEALHSDDMHVVDVRKVSEFEAEHIVGAQSFPLDYINDNLDKLPKEGTIYMHCLGAYRSKIANSILRINGYTNIIDVEGGAEAIFKTDVKLSTFVCPSTLT